MTRGTPSLRGYRGLIVTSLVFGAGVLVGHDGGQPVSVPVAQTAPVADGSAVALPSDAPVANLIKLRSMGTRDQARFLSKMTDPQLVALQTVAVTTPNVLSQANDEAVSRGLPELVAGRKDSFGAVQAVPVPLPAGKVTPRAPDLGPTTPDPAPWAGDACDDPDCKVVSV